MAKNPDLPAADPNDLSAIQRILVEQGHLQDGAEAAEVAAEAEGAEAAEAAAEEEAPVYDSPEEEAAAAALAAEAGEGEEPAEEAEPAVAATPEAEEPQLVRGAQALAQYEAKLRQREGHVRELERQAQAKVAEAEARLRLAIDDPAAFYKALGIDKPADIAVDLWYAEHGDAPPQAKAKLEQSRLTRKLQQLEQREAQREAANVTQQQQARAYNFIASSIPKVPAELTALHREIAADQNSVIRAVYGKIQHLGMTGEIQPGETDEEMFAKAARSLNQDVKNMVERTQKVHLAAAVDPKTKPAVPSKSAPGAKTPAPVAGEKKTAITKTNTNRDTPLTRPRVVPKTREEELDLVTANIRAGKHLQAH